MRTLPAPPADADPTGSKVNDQERALCLSGGGWRAALFHAGGLKRLNELGVLSQITTIPIGFTRCAKEPNAMNSWG